MGSEPLETAGSAIALDDQLLEVGEVAALLRVSRHRALCLIRDWDLPGIKVGKKWKVSKAALAAWMARGGCAMRSPRPPRNPVGRPAGQKRRGRKPGRAA